MLQDSSSWEGFWSTLVLYIDVIMACLNSIGISRVFREALYSSWRGWARLLLHYFGSIVGNSSEPPGEICEIVFIESMMSSHIILMSDPVFECGGPKKSFGYLIVIVGCVGWVFY